MLVTTLLVATVARGVWRWPLSLVIPAASLFLLLDLTFVSANLHKIPDGGWFPLLVGAVSLTAMLSWRRGRAVAFAKRDADAQALETFIEGLSGPDAPTRMPGTAVYLTKQSENVPAALSLNLKHNGVVHAHVLLLKVTTDRVPRVSEAERIQVEKMPNGFRNVEMHFGFAEKPDVPAALAAHHDAIGCDPATSSFFLGREEPVPSLRPDLPRCWTFPPCGIFRSTSFRGFCDSTRKRLRLDQVSRSEAGITRSFCYKARAGAVDRRKVEMDQAPTPPLKARRESRGRIRAVETRFRVAQPIP